MKYDYQKGDKDCYPTCFRNAFKHFDIKLNDALEERLALFNNGAENCSADARIEKPEKYNRSIFKFALEWWQTEQNTFHNDDDSPQSFAWAQYLMEQGVELFFCKGPIERKQLLIEELTKEKLVICPIMIPSTIVPHKNSRHSVLIITIAEVFY